MHIKKYGDLVTGVFFLALSILIFIMASRLPPSLMGGLASDFMPKVMAVITVILSLFEIKNGIGKIKAFDPTAQEVEEDKPEYWRVLVTIIGFTLYVLLMPSIGFIITTIVYFIIQMIVLAPKEKRNYLLFVVISIVFSIAIYYVFRNALNVMLPVGILG